MSVKLIFRRGFGLLGLLLLTLSARAEHARLPYDHLYNSQKALAALSHAHTNLAMVLTMTSTLTNVHPSDLRVYIDAKAGRIPVLLGPVGNFAVPLNDDLRAENPWVAVNQPKGTMKLNWQVGISVMALDLTNKMLAYARLLQPAQDYSELQGQLRQIVPGTPRMGVDGVKVTFPTGANRPSVVIHAASGDRTITANAEGEALVPLSAELLKENPEMTLSENPKMVEIVTHPLAD